VGTGVATAHDNLDGWGVGVGVDHDLGDRLSARAEYCHSDLGSGSSFDRRQTLLEIAYHL
jgi:opacity protein-like surface antigen